MKKNQDPLSRREREIMDVLYRLGEVTASEVVESLPDPPSNSAVRTTLRILEEKGHVRREQHGMRYLYRPTVTRDRARRSALNHLVSTFFEGSPETVVSTLLDEQSGKLSDQQLDSLVILIERARKDGR